MSEYFVSVRSHKSLPTADELAKQIYDLYGIVNYRNEVHVDFVRAFMNAVLADSGRRRILKHGTGYIQVYEDASVLYAFVENLVQYLKTEPGVCVSIPSRLKGKTKYWQVFLKNKVDYQRRAMDDLATLPYKIAADDGKSINGINLK